MITVSPRLFKSFLSALDGNSSSARRNSQIEPLNLITPVEADALTSGFMELMPLLLVMWKPMKLPWRNSPNRQRPATDEFYLF